MKLFKNAGRELLKYEKPYILFIVNMLIIFSITAIFMGENYTCDSYGVVNDYARNVLTYVFSYRFVGAGLLYIINLTGHSPVDNSTPDVFLFAILVSAVISLFCVLLVRLADKNRNNSNIRSYILLDFVLLTTRLWNYSQRFSVKWDLIGITFLDTLPDNKWAYINKWKAGVHADIFPIDSITVDLEENEARINQHIVEFFESGKQSYCSDCSNCKTVYFCNTSNPPRYYYEKEELFPLITADFEGYNFSAPNKIHNCLVKEYGDYMAFPKGRFSAHSEFLSYPVQNGIDMEEVHESFRRIAGELENEIL